MGGLHISGDLHSLLLNYLLYHFAATFWSMKDGLITKHPGSRVYIYVIIFIIIFVMIISNTTMISLCSLQWPCPTFRAKLSCAHPQHWLFHFFFAFSSCSFANVLQNNRKTLIIIRQNYEQREGRMLWLRHTHTVWSRALGENKQT